MQGGHFVLQRSRRGSGQDDWGRLGVKIDAGFGLVTGAKAKDLELMVDRFLEELEEKITGQKALPLADKPAPVPVARGQRPLPLKKAK